MGFASFLSHEGIQENSKGWWRFGLAPKPTIATTKLMWPDLGKNLAQVATPTLGSEPEWNLSANAVRRPPLAINGRCVETPKIGQNVWSARLQEKLLGGAQSAQMYPAFSWRLFSGP